MKESEIFINQVGYRPLDSKNVFVSKAAKAGADSFGVYEKSSGKSASNLLRFRSNWGPSGKMSNGNEDSRAEKKPRPDSRNEARK